MISIWRAKFWLGTFLTTIFVVVSQEIKTLLPLPAWMIAVIAFIISTCLSTLFIKAALSSKRGRMMIMGKNWIEGYWYLKTSGVRGHPHPITSDGISFISYEGESELRVSTYRAKTREHPTGFSSNSRLVMASEHDTRFSNHFTITESTGKTEGISLGQFLRDHNARYPSRYDGTVVLFSDGIERNQTADKIPAEVIEYLSQSNGRQWKDVLLEGGYDYLIKLIRDKPWRDQPNRRLE
jgi:hypothetical protein